MNNTSTLTQIKDYRTTKSGIISFINEKIQAEEKNAIGIAVILIIAGTMIASISAALAVHGEIAILPLIFSCVSAMGANAIAISQRPFKMIVWAFAINILGNSLLIIYQIFNLMI